MNGYIVTRAQWNSRVSGATLMESPIRKMRVVEFKTYIEEIWTKNWDTSVKCKRIRLEHAYQQLRFLEQLVSKPPTKYINTLLANIKRILREEQLVLDTRFAQGDESKTPDRGDKSKTPDRGDKSKTPGGSGESKTPGGSGASNGLSASFVKLRF